MNIVERIFHLLSISGKSATELGSYIGVKPSSISGWKSGSYPSSKYIPKIAEFFNVSVSFLVLGHDEELGVPKNQHNALFRDDILSMYEKLDDKNKLKIEGMIELKLHEQEELKKQEEKEASKILPMPQEHTVEEEEFEYHYKKTIPLLGNTAAGSFIEAVEGIYFEEQIPTNEDDADFALKVVGDSMEPTLHDGEIIEIQATQHVENGEIAVVKHYDDVTCKKVYRRKNYVELISINEEYEPIRIPPKEIRLDENAFRIVGRVLK